MAETPTPRTDAMEMECRGWPTGDQFDHARTMCRQLETDLEAENAETKKWVTLTAEKSQEATEWCAKFISERDNLQHLARVAGEALESADTQLRLDGYASRSSIRQEIKSALSEIQRIKNHE